MKLATDNRSRIRCTQRGGALLSVLWLSAALTAIAFSVAVGVRGEVSRAETGLDSVKTHFLAQAAVERAALYMIWGGSHRNPDGTARFWEPGMPFLRLPFPSGEATVEIIPEAAKLNLNRVTAEEMARLIFALGATPEYARTVAAAILDWRSPAPAGGSAFDAFYSSQRPSFRAPHASFQQIEELLLVRGVTPDLYYGRMDRTPEGALYPRPGLKDCVTVWAPPGPLDVNTVSEAVMIALGMPPQTAQSIAQLRRRAPITPPQLALMAPVMGAAVGRLGIGGGPTYTLRATARLYRPDGALSDLKRSVAGVVRFKPEYQDGYQVLQWRDNAVTDRPVFELWSR